MHCETDKIITASVPDPPFNARGGVPQTKPARAPLALGRIPTGISNGTRYRTRQLMNISTVIFVRHCPLHQISVLYC